VTRAGGLLDAPRKALSQCETDPVRPFPDARALLDEFQDVAGMDPLTDVSASATFPLPGAQVSRLHGMVLVVLSILLAFLKAVTLKLQFIPGAERRAWGFIQRMYQSIYFSFTAF
jgi:hypothetical protein